MFGIHRPERQLGLFWLTAIAFGVGAGVMAIEIVASRVLAPRFGASLFVWTSLILVVLVALAVGYWAGGIAAERGAGADFLGFIMAAAAALLVIGVWMSDILFGRVLAVLTGWTEATAALFIGSLLAAAVVFAMPVMLLGMVGPILVKKLSDGLSVAKASGRYLAWSTIGSVVGTVVPTLVLIPRFGSRLCVEIIAGLFVVMAAVTLRPRPALWLLFCAAPVMGLSVWFHARPSPAFAAEKESPYQLIRVWQQDDWRYLTFNEGSGIQSVLPPAGLRTGMYYDHVGLLPLIRPGDGRHQAAIIGLAGGTAARTYRAFLPAGTPLDIVGVEVDEAVIGIARDFFDLDATGVEVVNADGRTFLAATDRRFDTMLIDAYSTQLYVPPHLISREFFELAKSRLKPGGVIALNLNAVDESSPLFVAMSNTLAGVFREVAAARVPGSWNWIFFMSDDALDLEKAAVALPPGYDDVSVSIREAWRVVFDANKPIFTDDWAPVEFMTDAMIVRQAVEGRTY